MQEEYQKKGLLVKTSTLQASTPVSPGFAGQDFGHPGFVHP